MRHLRPVLIAGLSLALVACGGGIAAPGGTAPGGAPSGTAAPATTGATGTDAAPTDLPPATEAPPAEETVEPPTPQPTDAPVDPDPSDAAPTEAAATPGPSGSTSGAGAAACSGSDANRSFFAAAAAAVDWPVLCAVLPKGWFVSEGSYRQANGGKLLISYKGPAGAMLSLSEGAFCTQDDGCVPSGTELGEAALGPLGGTLIGLDDGGFGIVVDRGLSPSWLLVSAGLDQRTTVQLGAALLEAQD